VAAVTVHGRTVEQRYKGPSRWDFRREVKDHVGDRTILGSGDLFTPHDCLDMIAQTGVNGVTVARGAIGNPWIFSQAKSLARGEPLPSPPSLYHQRHVLRDHYRLAEELYGERCGPQMRKFGIKYSFLHPQTEEVRRAMITVRCRKDWEDVLTRYYAEDRPGRYPGPEAHLSQNTCEAASM
jgi:tRNA-dihydrouridine synthase B